MKKYMKRDEPLISILMAVYEPRMDWLRKQLESLNAQTYSNLRLYIRDDCSPTVPFKEIEECVNACIRSFPYKISRNEKNLGSNRTFERLTGEAEGEYFAYCDQDDIWLPEKLKVLHGGQECSGALLVCSDMYIINSEGEQMASSITQVRRHHKFRSGRDLAEGLLMTNFASGCAMLVASAAAKAAVPFCPYMVHDHYLALYCASCGEILSITEPLIRYRIHSGNQTGLMAGVTNKRSYGELRINISLKRFLWLRDNFSCCEALRCVIEQHILWMEARRDNWNGGGGRRTIWKYRRFSPLSSLFEAMAWWLPEPVFMCIIWLCRKNIF